jgi:hypothetical protein
MKSEVTGDAAGSETATRVVGSVRHRKQRVKKNGFPLISRICCICSSSLYPSIPLPGIAQYAIPFGMLDEASRPFYPCQ